MPDSTDTRPKDYVQIGVPDAAREAAREAKKDDETWGEYLQRCAEEPPRIERQATLAEIKNALRDVLEGDDA